MSEINLNEEVTVVVEDATVITTPIDDTLTISGDAADAKAVGDALALKADASSVMAISVNGQTADNQGAILINGTEIPMSGTDETTLKAAIDNVGAKTGADIAVNGDENAVSIEQAIANAAAESASVTQNVLQLGGQITDDSYALEGLAIGTRTLPVIDPNAVRSVNNTLPGSGGNVQITTVDVARQLQTDNAQVIDGTFIERPTGGGSNVGDGDAWLSVVRGNSVHTGIVEESFTVTVTSSAQEPITAEVTAPDTFRTEAGTGGTYTFTYTTAWDVDPATWGVTVTGTPVNGDAVSVVWIEADRGTITPSYPSAFNATNWNLYNHTVGYARVLKYSDEYNFKISGAYTSISFATTTSGTPLPITPVNGMFSIPSDGYVFVEGGNSTTTAIWMQWSDWTENYEGSFRAHAEEEISLATVMSTYFANGLCAVGSVADEININIGQAIQRIERMEYTAENIAAVIASGRAYDADENYIYAVLAVEVANDISMDGAYTAFDHGMEYFDTTSVGAYAQILYGENLIDKLRTDVVQISAQTMTTAQKAQARDNIDAAKKDISTSKRIDFNGLRSGTTGVTSGLNAMLDAELSTMALGDRRGLNLIPASDATFVGNALPFNKGRNNYGVLTKNTTNYASYLGTDVSYGNIIVGARSTSGWSFRGYGTIFDITSRCTGFEGGSAPGNTKVYYNNSSVIIHYQGYSTTHSASSALFTLPEGFRPSYNTYIPFVKNDNAYGVVQIATTGAVTVNMISSTTASGRVYFHAVIPINGL